MCEVCRQLLCNSQCPNAPETKPVYKCEKCGCGIYDGEQYFDSPEGYICKDCMDDMTVSEVIEIMGKSLKTA